MTSKKITDAAVALLTGHYPESTAETHGNTAVVHTSLRSFIICADGLEKARSDCTGKNLNKIAIPVLFAGDKGKETGWWLRFTAKGLRWRHGRKSLGIMRTDYALTGNLLRAVRERDANLAWLVREIVDNSVLTGTDDGGTIMRSEHSQPIT